jgi:magnesium transporter
MTIRVNPLYYVTFTTATLCASFIMFKGFNTSDAVNTLSLLCGFLIIFSGVYLLNLSRKDPVGDTLLGSAAPGRHGGFEDSAIPTDSMTAFGTRRSMQARTSSDAGRHSRTHSWGSSVGGGRRSLGDREALMRDFSLAELAEDSGDDGVLPNGNRRKGDEEEGFRLQQHAGSMARLSGSGRPRVDGKSGATVTKTADR